MVRQWIELEMARCGDENRLVDLNAMWNIMNNTQGFGKSDYREGEWNALLDEIDDIIDNRVKGLKMLVRSKR